MLMHAANVLQLKHASSCPQRFCCQAVLRDAHSPYATAGICGGLQALNVPPFH